MFDALAQKKLFSEGFWAMAGQIMAAIGTLVGIRILTEVMPPDVFGGVALTIGLAALGLGLFCTPLMQGLMRFYPEHLKQDNVAVLRHSIVNSFRRSRVWLIAFIVLLASGIYVVEDASFPLVVAVIALLLLDIIRTFEITFLNAARRQKEFALISIMEAWGRPLFAVIFIFIFGASMGTVVWGYVVATLLVLAFFTFYFEREGVGDYADVQSDEVSQRIWRYALPLVPLAIIGWVSGVGDRYVIGGLLGLKEAGIYAAVYGLVSRPFLLLGRVVELTLRPVYQTEVSNQNHGKAKKALHNWLLMVTITASLALLFIILFHNQLAFLFLGENFRSGAELMPWIAAGYALLVMSFVYEKVCYAYEKTKYVLYIQLCGAGLTLLVTIIAVQYWGLYGAAVAVPVYFGLQLLVSIVMANHIERKAIFAN